MLSVRNAVPWGMVWLRVLLCPAIVVAARSGMAGRWLGVIVVVALVDDIYDGKLARRWGGETPALRLADSCADTVFYLGAAAALWVRRPQVIRANLLLLGVLFGLKMVRYVVDFTKFHKAASYHSYLAKVWGLLLGTALVAALGVAGFDGWVRGLVGVAIGVGVLANLEGLAMSLLLPFWRNDVRTLRAAWQLRQSGPDLRPGDPR